MNKNIILIFIIFPILGFGQIENRWQPDSIYLNRQVKKIYVYLSSKKHLSQIIEFDSIGKKIRLTRYNNSNTQITRESKSVDKIYFYKYDSKHRLTKIVDSIGRDSTVFKYGKNNKLIYSRKKLGDFTYETQYYYEPLVSTTTHKKDSILVYHKTKEYEKDFYVNRFFGYVVEPTLKKKNLTHWDKDSIVRNAKISYSNYDSLKRFEENEVIKNIFNEDNQLIESEIKSVFLNNRINEYKLYYKYYKNGLLKSVSGYFPRYYKYEYWE